MTWKFFFALGVGQLQYPRACTRRTMATHIPQHRSNDRTLLSRLAMGCKKPEGKMVDYDIVVRRDVKWSKRFKNCLRLENLGLLITATCRTFALKANRAAVGEPEADPKPGTSVYAHLGGYSAKEAFATLTLHVNPRASVEASHCRNGGLWEYRHLPRHGYRRHRLHLGHRWVAGGMVVSASQVGE